MAKEVVYIQCEVEEVQEALKGTAKSLTSIQRQVIAVIAKGTVKAIKSAITSSDLKRRSGELLKCYGYRIKKDGSEGNIYPKGKSGSHIFPKVMALSFGNEKRNIKPRGFVQSGKAYAEGNNYESELNKLVDKNLKKYWG